jgi:hypothetical protein
VFRRNPKTPSKQSGCRLSERPKTSSNRHLPAPHEPEGSLGSDISFVFCWCPKAPAQVRTTPLASLLEPKFPSKHTEAAAQQGQSRSSSPAERVVLCSAARRPCCARRLRLSRSDSEESSRFQRTSHPIHPNRN